jgi:hypothetical protein
MEVSGDNVSNSVYSAGNNAGSVLEEELQEKGAMFRDFLTSRVRTSR